MKRKVTALIAAAAMAVSLLPSAAFGAIGGNGSAAEPYTINSLEDLKEFRDKVNDGDDYSGKTVVLNADITMDSESWTPIGDGSRSGSGATGDSFSGIFDGNGKKITRLTISGSAGADQAMGLFGVVKGGTVKDLTLEGVEINLSGNECAGGAIGLMVGSATADTITVSGTVSAKRGNGGIVGRMTIEGTISNCINNAAITATGGANAGGIIGAAYYTGVGKEMNISGCTNNGAVTGNSGAVGGIAGLSSANVSGCKNTAPVTGNGTSVGGVIGEQQNYGSILSCSNTANVTNDSEGFGTGGIVGWVRYNGSDDNYPAKEVIEVINNENSGSIDGGNDGGGIVGTLYNAGKVYGNENKAETIKGKTFAAGIVGNIQNTETPTGGIPKTKYDISNNVSTTSLSNITGQSKAEYAYNNPDPDDSEGMVKENADVWAASVGEDRYTMLKNAAAAAEPGDTIVVLNVSDTEKTITVKEGVVIDNRSGNPLTVKTTDIQTNKGYDGKDLPAGPAKEGNVWTVTPENAQYTLDGAYGSISGKTINFSAGNYDVLELNRPTKFAGSETEYYNMTWSKETGWVKDDEPVATPNDLNTGIRTYVRAVKDVTFTSDEGAVLAGFNSGSGHVYGNEGAPAKDYVTGQIIPDTNSSYHTYCSLENISFKGLTITGNVIVSNYSGDQAQAVNKNISFTGCSFTGDESKMADGSFAAVKLKGDSRYFTNVAVSDCSFTNYFQGVYVQGVDGLKVENSTFDGTTHNAIAVQSSTSNPVKGKIAIDENIIRNAKDRAVRIGDVDNGTEFTVQNNVMIDSGDSDGELIKAQTIDDNVKINLEYNYWDGSDVNVAVAINSAVPQKTGIVSGTFDEDVTQYVSEDAGIAAVFTAKDGSQVYLVGKETVAEKLENAAEGDSLRVLETFGKVEIDADVADGVIIENNSEQAVTVAGQTAEPGKTIVAGQQEQDETKPDGDGDKPAPDKAAATGDDTNMIPFIVAVIAALLCGLVVVFARKRK